MQYAYHYVELSVSYDTQSKIRTVDIPLQIIIVFNYSKQSSSIIYILFFVGKILFKSYNHVTRKLK